MNRLFFATIILCLIVFSTSTIFAAGPGMSFSLSPASPQGMLVPREVADIILFDIFSASDCEIFSILVGITGKASPEYFNIGLFDPMTGILLDEIKSVKVEGDLTRLYFYDNVLKKFGYHLVGGAWKELAIKAVPLQPFTGGIQVVIEDAFARDGSGNMVYPVYGLPLSGKVIMGGIPKPIITAEVLKKKDSKYEIKLTIPGEHLSLDLGITGGLRLQNVQADAPKGVKVSYTGGKAAKNLGGTTKGDNPLTGISFSKPVKSPVLNLMVVGREGLVAVYTKDWIYLMPFKDGKITILEPLPAFPPLPPVDGFGAPENQDSPIKTWGEIKTR